MVSEFQVLRRVSFIGFSGGQRVIVAAEGGYLIINWLLSHLGITFHGFLVLLSFLYMYAFYKFVARYSENKLLSFALFIGFVGYKYCFGLLRYWIAISFFLLSIHYLEENKKASFATTIIILFFVYRSMIIYLSLLFLYDKKINRTQFIKVGISWIVLLLASRWLYSMYISRFLVQLGHAFIADFRWNNLLLMMFIMFLLIFSLVSISVFEIPINRITLWCFILSVYIEIIGMNNGTFARLIWLLFIGVVVLIPNLIKRYKNSLIRVLMPVVIYVTMFSAMLLTYENYEIVPYRFFWE